MIRPALHVQDVRQLQSQSRAVLGLVQCQSTRLRLHNLLLRLVLADALHELHRGVHVLVPAPAAIDHDAAAVRELRAQLLHLNKLCTSVHSDRVMLPTAMMPMPSKVAS